MCLTKEDKDRTVVLSLRLGGVNSLIIDDLFIGNPTSPVIVISENLR